MQDMWEAIFGSAGNADACQVLEGRSSGYPSLRLPGISLRIPKSIAFLDLASYMGPPITLNGENSTVSR